MTSEIFAQGTDTDGAYRVMRDTLENGERMLRLERNGATVEIVALDDPPHCGSCGGIKGARPDICDECRIYAHIPYQGDW